MKIRFGVIGLGNRGSGFAMRTLIQNPDIELVAVCDPNTNKFDLFPETKIKKFEQYSDLLDSEEVDAVFIATPDATHEEIILASINREKHIICEKPLEIGAEKVENIQNALKGYQKVFMVGYVLRYAPLYVKAKELVSSGIIGQIKLANVVDHIHYGGYAFFHDWHRNKINSKGLLLQKGTHSLDVLNWIVDDLPKQVAGFGGLDVFGEPGAIKKFGRPLTEDLNCGSCQYQLECVESIYNLKKHKNVSWQENWPDSCVYSSKVDVDDHQSLLIKYKEGAIATYTLCQFAAFYRREFQFFGTEGELYFDDQNHEIIISNRLKREKIRYQFESFSGHGGGDEEMLQDFIKCLRFGIQPRANLDSSVVATHLAFAAEQAIEDNKIIEIKD